MAHEIVEGLDKPMYADEPAWHGLGTVVKGAPNVREALRIAELDYEVSREPLYVSDGGEGALEVEGWSATVREDLATDDPRRILGVVGSRYTVMQNADAFEIVDTIIGSGSAEIESAGSLKGGRIVWLLARLPERLKVVDDELAQYLLLKNSHDGSGRIRIGFTPVRVVCWNTLSMALGGLTAGETSIGVKHTRSAQEALKVSASVMGKSREYFKEVGETLRNWAGRRVSRRFAEAYLKALVPDPVERKGQVRRAAEASGTVTRLGRPGHEETAPRTRKVAAGNRERIMELWDGGQRGGRMTAVRGTAYGLFNAVTEWIDYGRGTRVYGLDADAPDHQEVREAARGEARLESTWMGSGAALRGRAAALMVEGLEYADEPERMLEAAGVAAN